MVQFLVLETGLKHTLFDSIISAEPKYFTSLHDRNAIQLCSRISTQQCAFEGEAN